MKIKKVDTNFTQVSNNPLNDKRLSWKAKGVFAYLYSKPDDWDFSSDRIKKDSKDGRDALLSGLKELEEVGYLKRKKLPTGKVEYVLDYNPNTEKPTLGQNPDPENPTMGKSHSGKTRRISNTEYNTNTKEEQTSVLFEEFWKEYPNRKRDRDKCLEKFSSFKEDIQKVIVEDVKVRKVRHSDWVKNDHQFVPAPLVYLRNKRWEEPIDNKGSGIKNVYHNSESDAVSKIKEKMASRT